MNKQIFFLVYFFFVNFICAQKIQKSDLLFKDQTPLKIKLSVSNDALRLETDDTTYIKTSLSYYHEQKWQNINISIRARGNFRRSKCYFPPTKIKIKKSKAKQTLFQGNKRLKLVLPCLLEEEKNDNVIQEFIAYKFYEKIAPYHFKTRKVDIEFNEVDGDKIISHSLKGFLIEDDKRVAERHGGKIHEKYVHPKAMDHLTSVQNSFFQFMIGNTDFSVAYQHNGKLLSIDGEIYPLPYDFDLSGLVDASYATVSSRFGIKSVRQRKYRGFKREGNYVEKVRAQFRDNKAEFLKIVEKQEPEFELPSEYETTRDFLMSFYEVIEENEKFEKQIIKDLRTR